MNISAKNDVKNDDAGKSRILGYQVAKELTNQELLMASGGTCDVGQSSSWSGGCSGSCTYEDDCK